MQIWSSADGGGALTVFWDFTKKVQTYPSFCTSDNETCLYTTVDPGFMAPPTDPPPAGLYRLVDGTSVTLMIVTAQPSVSMQINGVRLQQPGASALLGTMPTIHTHPSWQVLVPGDQFGDFMISYKLMTDSPLYTESQVFTSIVTNVQPTPDASTATPTPEPTPSSCVGDCNGDGKVTIDEILMGVNMALGELGINECPALDPDHSGTVSIDEILAAVNNVLVGCPTPVPATLDEIQRTIFTPRCATLGCHTSQSAAEGLILEEGMSHGELVNVSPTIPGTGMLRVDPGHPENSFLLVKVEGQPPLGQGSQMPLSGPPFLNADEVELIRNWILQGAQP